MAFHHESTRGLQRSSWSHCPRHGFTPVTTRAAELRALTHGKGQTPKVSAAASLVFSSSGSLSCHHLPLQMMEHELL